MSIDPLSRHPRGHLADCNVPLSHSAVRVEHHHAGEDGEVCGLFPRAYGHRYKSVFLLAALITVHSPTRKQVFSECETKNGEVE